MDAKEEKFEEVRRRAFCSDGFLGANNNCDPSGGVASRPLPLLEECACARGNNSRVSGGVGVRLQETGAVER
jgi:hypothetical protein